jgi:hypothetical protein
MWYVEVGIDELTNWMEIWLMFIQSNGVITHSKHWFIVEIVETIPLKNHSLSVDTSTMKDLPWVARILSAYFISVRHTASIQHHSFLLCWNTETAINWAISVVNKLSVDFVVIHMHWILCLDVLFHDSANWSESLTIINHSHMMKIDPYSSSYMTCGSKLCTFVCREVRSTHTFWGLLRSRFVIEKNSSMTPRISSIHWVSNIAIESFIVFITVIEHCPESSLSNTCSDIIVDGNIWAW